MKPGISIIPLNLPLRRETSQLQSIIPVCLPAPDDRQHGAALHRPAGERRGAALREERRRVYLLLRAEVEHREVGFIAELCLRDDAGILMRLELSAPTLSQARGLTRAYEKQADSIYQQMMTLLLGGSGEKHADV